MKINLLRSAGRSGLYVSLALAGLLFVNCSKDDDTPPNYDFEQEFGEIEEMPVIEDPDPEIVEPNLGGVEASAKTQAVLSDLEDGGDLSAESKASIQAVEDFSASLSAEAKQEVENLTEARIEEIFNMTELDGTLKDVAASLENAPAEVKELLPTINFSSDFDGLRQEVLSKTGVDLSKTNFYAEHSGTNCDAAAQAEYDKIMAAAVASRDEQLATFEANYARRLTEAETRATSRQANIDEAYATYKTDLLATAMSVFNFANSLSDEDLKAALKSYAFIFAVASTQDANYWYSQATKLIDSLETKEKANALTIRDAKVAEANTAFNTVKNNADAVLSSVVQDCHNQGGGN